MHTENLELIGDLPFHVMLACSPLGLVRATARHLRHDGMTVDTGTVTLDEQAEVELSFTQRHNGEFITHRIRARVSASSRGRAVLAFCDYARTTQEVLRKLFHGETAAPAASHGRPLPRLRAPAWMPPTLPPRGRFA
jgi:hypothetical protein